jgi:iron complex outermembrane recepter protein
MAIHRILGCAFGLISALPIAFFAAGSARAADPSTGSETKSEDSTALETIVVTAMKREESLQSIAASISAVSGATIERERLRTYDDLQNAVAGLVSIPSISDFGFVNMRGTYTQFNDAPGQEQPTSVYIDDVATLGITDLGQKLYDIDRVEVLRGPQGTAFGKNTVGGVISIHTKGPSFTPDVQLSATGGNFGLAEFQGLVTGPLSDRVAAKVSGYFQRRDGTFHDPVMGGTLGAQRVFGIRGQVLANVTDKFTVRAGADYLQDDSDSAPATFLGNGHFDSTTSAFGGPPFGVLPFLPPALVYPPFGVANDPNTTLQAYNTKTARRALNGFAKADWDLDFATLTSITGYRHNTTSSLKNFFGDPLPILLTQFGSKSWETTEELRLVSPADAKFTWLAGIYVSLPHEERTTSAPPAVGLKYLAFDPVDDLNPADPGPQRSLAIADTKSVSAFAEVGYEFTRELKLVLGGRYTHDHKTGTVDVIGNLLQGINFNEFVVPQSGSWSAFTPKATLEFTPTKDTLFYATVSRGYVGGGFEANGGGIQPASPAPADIAAAKAASIAIAQIPYRPEYATNYEIGAKTRWLHNRLTANISIYREDFKDLQFLLVRPVVPPFQAAGNAGRTRSQGVDLEIRAAPAPWLHLGVTYSYSDDKFLTDVVITPAGYNAPGSPASIYASGNHLPLTPANALNLSAEGKWVLPSDRGTVSAGGDITFRSRIWGDGFNNDAPQVHDRTGISGLLNASIDYMAHDGHWDVRLWGRNLTDTRYGAPTSAYFVPAVAFGYTGSYFSLMQWNPPRTFGVTASYYLR